MLILGLPPHAPSMPDSASSLRPVYRQHVLFDGFLDQAPLRAGEFLDLPWGTSVPIALITLPS
ncbi:hypothetical protein MAMT_02156 [Methylacidimicrobium tartarophylax]|uniref:Uncharacterized protein n=1 Tax=Methylacidimicrobium tartarophylax TaxID=1041768 RepID=A0A5E6MIU7_9BACT|nr:hypothetical protein MAMT_02156 [Methylacidimicrobium tartarophylax]